jgi:hypothetical protein
MKATAFKLGIQTGGTKRVELKGNGRRRRYVSRYREEEATARFQAKKQSLRN